MRVKQIVWFLVIVSFFFLIVGCGGGDDNTTASNGENQTETNDDTDDSEDTVKEEVEIRFAWWGNTERDAIYNEILDLYEEQNPHVTIIREPSGWGDYWTRLSTQTAGGNAPDVFGLHLLLYGTEYLSKDVIEPLDPYVESGLISLEGWDESVIDAGKYNGNLYALAKGVTTQGLLTNLSFIESLGLELPSTDMTYNELMDFAKEAVNVLGEDEYVIGDPTIIEHGIETWAVQKGGSFISEDGTSLGFSKEDLIEYWTYWDEMRTIGAIPSAQVSAEYSGMPEESTHFAQGKAIFIDRPINRARMFAGYMPEAELTIARYPLMEDGVHSGGEQLQVPAIVMSKNAKHKEEAAKLISWFVNDLEATKIYNAENGIPGTAPVRENLQGSLGPIEALTFDHFEKVVADIPATRMRPEGSVTVLSAYLRYAEEVAFGRTAIEDAVDAFFEEAERILAN
ncbi:multiple sugar transport system substrate-binding protein [Evansella vedderi]|uniref:Multiple sugar transport system substrate-binding protein n=1 Tax=Evansella vedderi TaxID=38282 RepID=A0ABU0A271_9BACI|nr:extracellular solute-binding protein [Evansella vedderi]MDQ0257330.1 multiple sugar transport system substrate-binding protein [Evansella vedderi]